MIQERYCSYEVAKLLKEKGFDEPCRAVYEEKNLRITLCDYSNCELSSCVCAPTHQMAMDWLRKEHCIYADPIKQGNYNDCSEYYSWIVARMGIIHRNSTVADKLSYKEAVEAALKFSLTELI